MKVLVDTSVWSLSLRRKPTAVLKESERQMVASLSELIQDGRTAMIGPIRQEILSGIKDSAQFERLRGALAAFPDEPITTRHYEEAARYFNLCRSHGVECGPVDILICAVAIAAKRQILTTDGGLLRCIEALKAEGLIH